MNIKNFVVTKYNEICLAPARIILVISIILVAIAEIEWFDSIITVPGNVVQFNLTTFDNCEIKFKESLSVKTVGMYENKHGVNPAKNESTAITTKEIGQQVKTLKFDNFFKNQNIESNSIDSYRIIIYYEGKLRCELVGISTNGQAMGLKSFFDNNLRSQGQYVGVRYIRENIALVIEYYNDTISNWVLTFLALGIIALAASMVKMELIYLFYSQKAFKDYLKKKFSIKNIADPKDKSEAFDEYLAHWFILNNRFRFLQVLGPAIGFIFTVSSLIVALSPALHDANNLDAFMNGIYVAMVSTFLGLLLRILAIESARVNDALLIRVELILKEVEK